MVVLSALFESGGTAVGEKPGRVRVVPVRDIAERYGAFVLKTTEFLGRFTGCGLWVWSKGSVLGVTRLSGRLRCTERFHAPSAPVCSDCIGGRGIRPE